MIKDLGKSMILVTDKLLDYVKEQEKTVKTYDGLLLVRSLTNRLEEIHDSFLKEINSF
jgi:hypothetical protein